MGDKWRGQVRTTLQDKPAVLLEIQINRTIAVTQDNVSAVLAILSETHASVISRYIHDGLESPPDQHAFMNTDWTDTRPFPLGSILQIVQKLEGRPFFRIEGDAKSGYRGVFATVDREISTPLTLETIPKVIAQLTQLAQDARNDGDSGLESFCKDASGMIEPLATLCRNMKDIQDHMAKTQQERDQMHRTEHDVHEDVHVGPELIHGDAIDKVEHGLNTA
jgi:hypothetical protein